jgi:hypothetical protein
LAIRNDWCKQAAERGTIGIATARGAMDVKTGV